MITANHTTNGPLAYPVFAENQVLSHAHLNNLVSYLDSQVRLTRATLIGTGIVCGFEPALAQARDQLTISRGCGITTNGHLIADEERILTHYRRAQLGSDDFPGEVEDLAHEVYELFESESPGNVLPETNNPIVQFHESQETGGTPLANILSERILILLLDIDDKQRSSCIYDCDEAGIHRTLSIRVLVVHRNDAETIIRAGYDPKGEIFGDSQLDAVFNRAYYLPDLWLKRFGYRGEKGEKGLARIDLTEIKSLKAYVAAYARVTGPVGTEIDPIAKIAHAYRQAGKAFSPFFSSIAPDSAADFNALEDDLYQLFRNFAERGDAVKASDRLDGFQYFYDYLKDLTGAYEELRREAFDLMDDCMPPAGRFPRHLMLGPLVASPDCPPSVYRSHLSQPAIYNGNGRRVEHVRLLYERMRTMAAHFRMSVEEEIAETRITPSRSVPAPLGDRAIPFYYDPESPLYETWNFELSRRCRSEQNNSYYSFPFREGIKQESSDVLFCDIENYDFYRIEGHVGEEYAGVIRDINALRQRFNLPFDLIALKISILAESEEIDVDYMITDLELLYTKCRHRLVCILDQMADRVQGDLRDAVEEFRQKLTHEKGEEVGDFYDLVGLNEEAHFDRFSALYETVFSSDIGRQYTCLGCEPASIQSILEAYRDRVTDIRQRLLFHKFAGHHPGMEHRGGVPRGGTFVLVYINEGEQEVLNQVAAGALEKVELVREHVPIVRTRNMARTIERDAAAVYEKVVERLKGRQRYFDAASKALKEAETILEDIPGGEELSASIARQLEREVAVRTHTVVGDFCLPYVCCSKMPPVSFVVAQPQPIVLLEDFSYCEDDPGPYTFIVHPEGGRLEGPGVEPTDGGYQFVPRHADIQELPVDADGKRQVTFTYYAEGGVDTLTVEILPVQNAAFTIPQLPESGIICREPGDGSTRYLLEPETPDGTFETDGPPLETEDGGVYFDPATVEPGTTVRITYTLPQTADACGGSSTQTVTVGETPDPGFTGLAEGYCVDDEPVTLVPDTSGSEYSSEFSGEGVEFVEEIAQFRFNPSAVRVGAASRTVTITHTIVGPDDCPGIAEQSVTVYAVPEASFTFETALQDPLCVNPEVEAEEYRLIPAIPGGEFTTEIGGQTGTRGLIRDGETVRFRPVDVLPDTSVTITYTVGAGPGCTGTESQTVTLVAVPDPAFTIADSFCADDDPVTLVPDNPDPAVTSKFSGDGVRFDASNQVYLFDPRRVETGTSSRDVFISHTATREDVCGKTVRRTVTIHPLPDSAFEFEPELPDVLCVDPQADPPESYQLMPEVEGGKFITQIQGEEGTTGLDREGEIVLIYPGELPAETDVEIIYEVANPQGCTDRSTRSIVVHHLPPARFEPIPETTGVEEGPIVLSPGADTSPDGVFTASFGPFDSTTEGISREGDTRFFEPAILLQFDLSLPHPVTITYTVTDEWGCQGTSTQTVVVQPRDTGPENGGIDFPGGGGIDIDLGGGDIVSGVDLTGGGGVVDVTGDFRVTDMDSPVADLELSPDAVSLFAERRNIHAGSLRDLALEDPALTDTKSFQMVNKYLEVGISRPAPESAKLYHEVVSVVLPVYKRADDPRQSMYRQLIEVATRGLFDRLAAEGPSAGLLSAVSAELRNIQEAGIDLNKIVADWDPDEVRSALPDDQVSRLLSLLP